MTSKYDCKDTQIICSTIVVPDKELTLCSFGAELQPLEYGGGCDAVSFGGGGGMSLGGGVYMFLGGGGGIPSATG